MATTHMHRLMRLAALVVVASVAKAQDTTVVVVRHLPAQQDTTVTVRHIAPAPQATAPAAGSRLAPQYGAQRYGLRNSALYAKDPFLGTTLSFLFPGGGQYYAGNAGKGFLLTALAIGAPIIGYANVNHHPNDGFNSPGGPGSGCDSFGQNGFDRGCRGIDWTPAAIGLTVGIGSWLYGMATAGSDVQHWNQAHGVRFVAGPGRVGFAVAVP